MVVICARAMATAYYVLLLLLVWLLGTCIGVVALVMIVLILLRRVALPVVAIVLAVPGFVRVGVVVIDLPLLLADARRVDSIKVAILLSMVRVTPAFAVAVVKRGFLDV